MRKIYHAEEWDRITLDAAPIAILFIQEISNTLRNEGGPQRSRASPLLWVSLRYREEWLQYAFRAVCSTWSGSPFSNGTIVRLNRPQVFGLYVRSIRRLLIRT